MNETPIKKNGVILIPADSAESIALCLRKLAEFYQVSLGYEAEEVQKANWLAYCFENPREEK